MSGVDAPAPWRIAFDNARDPYTARNALGAEKIGGGGGGGGGAPDNAEYIVAATDATLTAERVLTNTATITWDFTTPGQAKASTAAGGGNVSNSGTPTLGQYAKWTTATTIQGVSAATVLGDIGAQPLDATLTALAAYNTNGLLTQTAADTFTGRTLTGPAAGITVSNGNGVAGNPTLALADDLAALEALAGTNTIYYRSGTSAWTAVTIGSALTFTTGTLDRAALTGDVTASAGGNATTIANDAVTYAKIQNVSAASRLIGRGSAAGAGDPQEITLGTNLSMSGTTLNATGGGGAVTVAVQTFTTSGTYTPTSGMTYAIIECVGGGGGGGASYKASGYALSGGGGSGAYSRKLVTAADVGASKTVTIGAAGAGGPTSTTPVAGSAGGDTSVGTLCVAKGGVGGDPGASGVGMAGGLGGSGAAGTGDIKASGAPGGGGFVSDANSICYGAGFGGSSIFGGGARVSNLAYDAVNGIDATNYGSGGSGAATYGASGKAGGNGSAGIVIITEFK